ncbi:MAG: Stp1/IreP family PP2C-type Ser/Thr phosphatase [Armatimonadetes bacterium]|nr:Stp1/IreP family PP2C-type Ser/Thr phosphatase [Armatimonadota bacterium]MBS1725129.1 Stp1/IreP family PP2C-type Ser/Thr phosphatase [Armatimonadota bacterium]
MDEITAEYAVADLLPPAELRALAKVSIGAKTDLGRVRENNEDKFEFYVSDDEAVLASRGQVFVVCDGMGGHAAGQIASELASKTFIDVYLSHPAADAKEALVEALTAANRYVFMVSRSVPNRRGMGTTFTGMVLLQNMGYVVQVGDSRAYRLRNGELTMLTEDHTYMNEMIRMGVLTPEQAAVHPQKHVLTRAVGVEENVVCDVYEFEIREGDIYFLCSDGILNHVEDDQIGAILGANGPASAAWKLVGQALLGGGSDNATALVVRIDELKTFDLPE